MKVSLDDMTERERVVLTKGQLMAIIDGCVLHVECDLPQSLIAEVDMPSIIEVEEVIG